MEYLLGYLAFAVGINLIFFLIAYALRTDKLTDVSYSLTFIAIAVYAWGQAEERLVSVVLTVLVVAWGVRLGAYLLYRIRAIGKDARFDDIRGNFTSFFLFWLMQGLTCFIVMIPVVTAHHEASNLPGNVGWLGGLLALLGLVLETVADAQKFTFKRKHPDDFMHRGVWAYLQHPNYAGELLFWWGVFIVCIPVVPWYTVIGPLWISIIILRFSGIPLLREKWQEKYGEDPDFIAYQESTPKLIPGIY